MSSHECPARPEMRRNKYRIRYEMAGHTYESWGEYYTPLEAAYDLADIGSQQGVDEAVLVDDNGTVIEVHRG